MKKSCFILSLLFFLLSCTSNDSKTGSGNSVRKQAMDIAVKYSMDKFKEAKKTIDRNGIVTITDNQVNFVMIGDSQLKYIIDPSKISVGLIDDDAIEDAIVTIFPSKGQYLEIPEHLILINTDGKLMLNRVMESNMKIMGIKDRIITVEISTRSLNTPLRDCSVCKEIVKYQFKSGDLIRVE